MKNVFKAAALGLVAMGLSVNASAGPVSFFDSLVTQYEYLEEGDTKTYTHNFLDDGFLVGTHAAESFSIVILLYDAFDWLQSERVEISIAGAPGDTHNSNLNLWFDPYFQVGSTLAQALMQITDTGLLSVTITSLRGDFYLGDSYAVVKATNVAEPGMLALLLAGVGIAGFTFTRRRRTLGAKRN